MRYVIRFMGETQQFRTIIKARKQVYKIIKYEVRKGNKKPLVNIYTDRDLYGVFTYGSIPIKSGYGYRWTRIKKINGKRREGKTFLVKPNGTLGRRIDNIQKHK